MRPRNETPRIIHSAKTNDRDEHPHLHPHSRKASASLVDRKGKSSPLPRICLGVKTNRPNKGQKSMQTRTPGGLEPANQIHRNGRTPNPIKRRRESSKLPKETLPVLQGGFGRTEKRGSPQRRRKGTTQPDVFSCRAARITMTLGSYLVSVYGANNIHTYLYVI